MYYVSIIGNIGSGKTTVAKIFEDFGYLYIPEIVSEHSFLEQYYANQKRWALTMELEFEIELSKQLNSIISEKPPFLVLDWNIPGIFVNMMLKDGLVTKNEYRLFMEVSGAFPRPDPDLTIFLDVDPKICLKRIKKRGRPFEQDIKLPYVEGLEKEYRSYIASSSSKVVTIENNNIAKVKQEVRKTLITENLPRKLAESVA